MNSIFLHRIRIVGRILATSATLLGLCSCQELLLTDVGHLPPHFHEGASDCDVTWRMGDPDAKFALYSPDNPPITIGYCWHYGDNFFDEIGRTNNWGSWDLYFDLSMHLVGWQMAEPLPANYNARQAFARDISEEHWKRLRDQRAKQSALMKQLAEKSAKKQVAVQQSAAHRPESKTASPSSSSQSPAS